MWSETIVSTLFTIFIATLIDIRKDDLPATVEFVYTTNGRLFNLARLRFKTKTQVSSLIEFQYADHNSVATLFESLLQQKLNAFKMHTPTMD